jgi:UDP-N-acetylmuramate dehydrogenase
MLGRITGPVRFKEPLSFHTSLRIGGPAEIFVMPHDLDDIRYALLFADHEDLPVVVIGGGNNLLVGDRGLQAVVLKLDGCLSRAEFHGDEAIVGAGVPLSALIREAAALGLGGLECLAGIPATVGGALAMNAVTADGSIADLCSAVYLLHPDGTLGELTPTPSAFSDGLLTFPSGAVLVGARMQLERKPAVKIQKELRQRLKTKKAGQPLALASAGYVWKNPPSTLADRLIAGAGLRGKRINGAEISVKNANFIVNRGGATAADVLSLMELTRERVRLQTGVVLETEIKMLGIQRRPARVERQAQVAAPSRRTAVAAAAGG